MTKPDKTMEHRNGRICVHEWDRYPRSSVLAGQARKRFIDSFETVDEAKAAHPDARMSHPMLQEQNTFGHLAD